MKKLLTAILVLSAVILSSCGFSSYIPQSNEISEIYEKNADLFQKAAKEAVSVGYDSFISHTDYYQPEKIGTIVGLYISDTKEQDVKEYKSSVMTNLFMNCGVRSIAIKCTNDISACEFNLAGSGNYYSGIYYVSVDKPVYIGDFTKPLVENGTGYSYKDKDIEFYTEKIADNFYYFDAQM